MSDTHPDNDIICSCSGTTRAKIDSLISQGVTTLEGIARKTGAATGCGACDWDIERILEDTPVETPSGDRPA